MDFVSIGFFVSIVCLILVSMLFYYEGKRGIRIAPRARKYADFFVLRLFHKLGVVSDFLGRDSFRQIIHYTFHGFLGFMLAVLRRGENTLQNIMRANKTFAKNAERENMTRSKLEEIALHKVEHALTEDEKRAHKERSLNGL